MANLAFGDVSEFAQVSQITALPRMLELLAARSGSTLVLRALGGLLETFVFTELLKLRALTSRGFRLHHYRDRDGREIDFVCEGPGRRIVAIEVKASQSPRRSDTAHIAWLRDRLGDRFAAGIVFYLGRYSLSLGDRLFLLPVSALWDHAGA